MSRVHSRYFEVRIRELCQVILQMQLGIHFRPHRFNASSQQKMRYRIYCMQPFIDRL